MATDATGTPTSPDNIPTFNTAVDDPSGKGGNAQMAAIQTALSARPNTPVGISVNEAMIWNGSTFVRSSVTGLAPSGILGYPATSTEVLLGDGTWGQQHEGITSSTRTTPLTGVTATTFGTGSGILSSALTFTADGTSSYLACIGGSAYWSNASATANNVLGLGFDGAEYNRVLFTSATANAIEPLCASFLISTPTAASHSVTFVLYVGGGTGSITAGTAHNAGNPGPVVGWIARL